MNVDLIGYSGTENGIYSNSYLGITNYIQRDANQKQQVFTSRLTTLENWMEVSSQRNAMLFFLFSKGTFF